MCIRDRDGDSYTAAIPITDLSTVYANIRQRLGLEIGAEQEANAQRIYTIAIYGPAVPGGMMAGAATVSYTHLDVYKRQPFYRLRCLLPA